MTGTIKKVAIIGNQAFSLLNFRAPLVREIVARGHQVYALAPDFDKSTKQQVRELGAEPVMISLSRTGLNPVRDGADVLRLCKLLSNLGINTVLGFSIKPVVYGTLAAWFAGVPNRFALIAGLGYTFGVDAKKTLKNSIVHYVARWLYRLSLHKSKKIFMQNPDDADDFVNFGIVPRNKIIAVNGTGVDLMDWPMLPPVLPHPPLFVLAARLLVEKGIIDYVEAARIVKNSCASARFILLGAIDANPNGISFSQIEQWVAEGVIEWYGHVPVQPWLAQASVFVLPSYYREGVPRSIQEAMASGRPIITTNAPGCRETVIDGYNGYLIPSRNPEALAMAIFRFIHNPELIESMGAASRSYVEQKFDIRKVNTKIILEMDL